MATFRERFAFLISADGRAAIKEFSDIKRAADRELGAVEKRATGLNIGGKLGNLKSAAGGFIAGVGATWGADFAAQSVKAAQAAEVFRIKTDTVFGDSAEVVKRWADETNEAFGASETKVAGIAAGIGDLLVPIGATRKEAAEMSMKVVELAPALAAWSAGQYDASQVADILRDGILGETDALKSLGIDLNAAMVEARLAENGQKSLTGAARQLAEAVATQELIFEKSTDAQRTWTDGTMDAVKQQNALQAEMEESKERFGKSLQPTQKQAYDLGAAVLGDLNKELEQQQKIGEETDAWLGRQVDRVKSWFTVTEDNTAAQEHANRVLEHGSIGLIERQAAEERAGRAMAQSTATTRQQTQAMIEAARGVDMYGNALKDTLGAQLELDDASARRADIEKRIRDAIDGTTEATGAATEKVRTYEDVLSDVFDSVVEVDEAHQQATDAVEGLREALGQSTGSEDAGDFRDRFFGQGDPKRAAQSIVSAVASATKAIRSEVDAMAESGEIADTADARNDALRERLVALKEEFPQVAAQVDRYLARLEQVGDDLPTAEQNTRNLGKAQRDLAADTRDLIEAAEDEVEAMVKAGEVADTARGRHRGLLDIIKDLKGRFPELTEIIDTYVAKTEEAWQRYLSMPGVRAEEAFAANRQGMTQGPPGSPTYAAPTVVNITQNIDGDGLHSQEVADLVVTRAKMVMVGSRAV